MARKTVGSSSSDSQPVAQAEPRATVGRYEELKKIIQRAYEGDVTIDEAERLAARFLMVQIEVAEELQSVDLDARMKKNGLKAKRSMVYMEAATKGEKKPSDSFLDNHVTIDSGVQLAADAFENADAKRESLQLYFEVFKDAHIYFRGISKGRYE